MQGQTIFVRRQENGIQISVNDHTFTRESVITMTLGQAALLADTLNHAQAATFVKAGIGEPEATLLSMYKPID